MSNQLTFHSSQLIFGHLVDVNFDKILKDNFPDSKFVIFTDDTVSEHWLEYLITEFSALYGAEIIQIPPGEENKVIEICSSVWETLSHYEITRNDVIINFGGGVITDMGGFIASTFKRGLRFINIPTTLLAQVDASLGGKTGVDLGELKNQIGVFADPEFVFIDTNFLSTLPKDQMYSGYAEMLKHGLIADANYWKELQTISLNKTEDLLPFIKQSIAIKKSIVEIDYDEKDVRKTLNFGHTIGHAIESFYLKKNEPLLHGYAVAFGMIAEAYLSMKIKLISQTDFSEIKKSINGKFGTLKLNSTEISDILSFMKNDKKNSNAEINFSLLNAIGSCVYNQHVETQLSIEALNNIGAER